MHHDAKAVDVAAGAHAAWQAENMSVAMADINGPALLPWLPQSTHAGTACFGCSAVKDSCCRRRSYCFGATSQSIWLHLDSTMHVNRYASPTPCCHNSKRAASQTPGATLAQALWLWCQNDVNKPCACI
jgi:hypothetical protein